MSLLHSRYDDCDDYLHARELDAHFLHLYFSHYRCFRYCENDDYYDDLDYDDYYGCCYDYYDCFGFSLLLLAQKQINL